MTWDNSYKTGIEEIDLQHKKLFDLIDLAAQIDQDTDIETLHDEVVRILVKLNLYTIYHFESEESLLALNGYDEMEKHRREHGKFVAYLEKLHPGPEELKSKDTINEIVKFLESWIDNHILKTDFKYKDLLLSKIEAGTFIENNEKEPFVFPKELEFDEE
jgi:hemerythrin